jgi:diguanylate cyclase (GGDEF)-like protein
MTYIDSLTRLPNRHQFNEDLKHLYYYNNEKRPDIALLFIDLDGLKQVNDS